MRIQRVFRFGNVPGRAIMIVLVCLSLLNATTFGYAQTEPVNRAGLLTTNTATVELRRANTEAWIAVRQESIIAAGDSIRTSETGIANLNLFDGVLILDLDVSSELTVDLLQGANTAPNAELTLERGGARLSSAQTFTRDDAFRVKTPGLTYSLLSGDSLVRIEPSSRSSVVVVNGQGQAIGGDRPEPALIDAGQGIRSDLPTLSEVVPALDFPRLDSALDGCPGTFTLTTDARVNVRLGADFSFPRIGGVDPDSEIRFIGAIASTDWYRIRYRGGFGWINVSDPTISECAGLREFAAGYGPEDTVLYDDLTERFNLTPTPEPTAISG